MKNANKEKPELTEMEKAKAMLKAVYDDGEAEINGRVYKFHGTNHSTRKKVFGFYTSIQTDIGAGNFAFISSVEFERVESLINKMVTFEGNQLAKLPEHWDEYAEDYLTFITTALGVISYPFLKGSLTS